MQKALCVGINNYPVGGEDLNGCVNDARAWAKVLKEEYGFPSSDVRLLLDRSATKKNILRRVERLLAGARKGDVLVLTFSGHGTYVVDTSGDEERYDEAICPWDMSTELIVDDDLRALFGNLARGCRLTVVSDSCFSGTVTRASEFRTPDDRRTRFLRPRVLGLPELPDLRTATPRQVPESKMREVLVAACRDGEEAIDARFGSVHHGAMTFFALDILRAARYDLTYQALWDELVVRLDREGYPQEPQVEGRASARRRRVFS